MTADNRLVDRRFDGRTACYLAILTGLSLASACTSRSVVSRPALFDRSRAPQEFETEVTVKSKSELSARAEEAYEKGKRLRANSDPEATALFLEATILAWQAVYETSTAASSPHERVGVLYHDSLRGLIESAQQFGQIDPRHGIRLDAVGLDAPIPIRYHAFPWQPKDFHEWIPVRDYEDEHLPQKHSWDGWGVPLIMVRQPSASDRFMTTALPFSATVLLRPSSATKSGAEQPGSGHVLEVFNPLVVQSLPRNAKDTSPLARDLTAPIVWLRQNSPHLQTEAFLHPDQIRRSGQLIQLEPYQADKIPVVFVHGLLSDPLTWAGLINELRAHDWFNQRFQVWVYGYSTGRPFLRSAADFRHQWAAACTEFGGSEPDAAFQHAVIIGHSMGGLISKLQIAHSDDLLWESFADRPLDSLVADTMTREYLDNLFFFEPMPFIERAIFLGTPHGGSPIARESMGRFASHLVDRSHEFSEAYAMFLEQNRGAIKPFFARRLPTSVDLLEPEDPCLQAMRQLRVPDHIRLHSIIGTGRRMLIGGRADGVVPVESARHAGVESELLVAATHRRIQNHPETVQEILRILTLHLEECSPRLASTSRAPH